MEDNGLLDAANAVMAEMEKAYGVKNARRKAQNTLDALRRYDDKSDTRPFLEQFLSQLVGTFRDCSKISPDRQSK